MSGGEAAADVLVVGLGCAGASAALEAARAGASVVALDRAAPGGSSAVSGGELYLGGGTALQRACGFEDDPDQMYAYLHEALGPHPDAEKLRLYCDGSVEHYDWFCSLGIAFEPSLYEGVSWMPPTSDGLMWLGENAWPFTRIARPAPRGHRPATDGFGGWVLMDRLIEAVRDAGVDIRPDTRVTDLLRDDEGRVSGVRARCFGEDITYRARRGVVLATGGFADDAAMVADHAPVLIGHAVVSDGLDDGSGIRLGVAAGGSVRRMGATQIALSVVPALACRGVLVDGLGQRFINEDVYPGRFSQAAVRDRPGPWFTIVDETAWEDVPERERWGVQPAVVAETLAEVEAELGLPPGSLEDTVARYNRDAAAGEDTRFHKDPRWLRPLTSPYAAVDARRGFDPDGSGPRSGTGVSGFTLGGLRTSVDGEVLDGSGRPVPGLYAAGRVTSGIHGEGYVSGTSLGDGTFFGRRAGRAAAEQRRVP
ncbi:FAD-dependent oxidoreductase [Nocardioides sp. CCNWLW239]|uniref:FAD-dependent oxidoreductase n=1 Tax=Nocardioides sp. CCNWLW239 TaxID=3128902 RepID=UPI003016D23C